MTRGLRYSGLWRWGGSWLPQPFTGGLRVVLPYCAAEVSDPPAFWLVAPEVVDWLLEPSQRSALSHALRAQQALGIGAGAALELAAHERAHHHAGNAVRGNGS